MGNIRVVDARMGRGKTSAAIEYMDACKGLKRFIYITPYLKEVDRICDNCDFDQPDSDRHTKLTELKSLLWQRKNVATTHSLFHLMDDEALKMIRDFGYSLIIDEAIETVRKLPLSNKDANIIFDFLTDEDKDGRLTWKDNTYTGTLYNEIKAMADAGTLYRLDSAILCIMRPDMIESFEEVIMMTYLFGGQYQRAYLDFFGFDYKICGIDSSNGWKFTEYPDTPPPLDYHSLINLVTSEKLNSIGDKPFALSKNWYERRGYDDADIRRLRTILNTFFRGKDGCPASQRIWTTFKTQVGKIDSSDGRFKPSFVQLSERATNQYRDRTHVAYLVNRFIDPNIKKFFATKNIEVDEDQFALGEMLQFIWRSAIRDDKPIKLYIPSSRMRKLFTDWMENISQRKDTD